MLLNRANIDREFTSYLASVKSIVLPWADTDILAFMYAAKRIPLDCGPYPYLSLYEASNLIFADLILLMGVRQLLKDACIGTVALPFDQYEVSLGSEGAHDLRAAAGAVSLIGEAFNVTPSSFQSRKSSAVKKLRAQEADYRLIIFNADAANRPDYYVEKSELQMLYLPIGGEWTGCQV